MLQRIFCVENVATKKDADNNDELTQSKFLSYYSKPHLDDVKKVLNCQDIRSKLEIFRISAIRRIKIYISDSQEETLLLSSCTCPDYFTTHICQHLLACLVHKKIYDPSLEFKKQKKRGRKKKVGPALKRE